MLGPFGAVHGVYPVGAELLIFFQNSTIFCAAGNLACSNFLHQFRRGAGLGRFVQQSGRLDVQNGLAVDFDAAEPLGNSQKVVGGRFAERNARTPCPESINSTIAMLGVVQLLDNSTTQSIMSHRNGIDHPAQAGLGHPFTLHILSFGHVQNIHGLSIKDGIIKRRSGT